MSPLEVRDEGFPFIGLKCGYPFCPPLRCCVVASPIIGDTVKVRVGERDAYPIVGVIQVNEQVGGRGIG